MDEDATKGKIEKRGQIPPGWNLRIIRGRSEELG